MLDKGEKRESVKEKSEPVRDRDYIHAAGFFKSRDPDLCKNPI